MSSNHTGGKISRQDLIQQLIEHTYLLPLRAELLLVTGQFSAPEIESETVCHRQVLPSESSNSSAANKFNSNNSLHSTSLRTKTATCFNSQLQQNQQLVQSGSNHPICKFHADVTTSTRTTSSSQFQLHCHNDKPAECEATKRNFHNSENSTSKFKLQLSSLWLLGCFSSPFFGTAGYCFFHFFTIGSVPKKGPFGGPVFGTVFDAWFELCFPACFTATWQLGRPSRSCF